ncbi:hypothetical protein Thi970DRAFT_00824 [Thiorhodovibrio frisius]|uniref:PBP domain-containing protein n=1 Tax=Thiorhodovibrio frisius TaxID=631362 RepID=H8YXJ5_9GAMM|nr:hypothetical protein Thi970DRAFT_00824 [Thiorhodovibrio frisius]WPL22558.1 hypothetical protein Thiofri_02725 [Thiorhodovibrio frisius]
MIVTPLLLPKRFFPTMARASWASRRPFRRILLCLAMTGGLAHGQEVIVNSDVHLDAIDRNFARLLITMRMPQWPDKRPVTVFVLPDNNPVHESFAKRVLEVYPYQLRRTWDRQVFSGTGQAPRQVANEQEMIERVSQTAGAVGYVSSPPDTDLVKVLEVEK